MNSFYEEFGYLALFVICFLSATLIPLGSEISVLFFLQNDDKAILILLISSIGNTLGSCVNYYLGLKGMSYLKRKKLITIKRFSTIKIYFKKFGFFALFFSWLPIIGDPITFIAGSLRYKFLLFVVIVFLAKLFRYLLILFLI